MSGAYRGEDATQKQEFQNRLARIKAGGVNTFASVYVGSDTIFQDPRLAAVGRGKPLVRRKKRSKLWLPVALAAGFVTGAGSVVAARLARDMMADGALTGAGADIAMVQDAVAAMLIGIVIRMIFAFRGRAALAAQTLGVLAAVATMQNFVHANPDLWRMAFSEQWVRDVLSGTQANSILFQGISFVI